MDSFTTGLQPSTISHLATMFSPDLRGVKKDDVAPLQAVLNLIKIECSSRPHLYRTLLSLLYHYNPTLGHWHTHHTSRHIRVLLADCADLADYIIDLLPAPPSMPVYSKPLPLHLTQARGPPHLTPSPLVPRRLLPRPPLYHPPCHPIATKNLETDKKLTNEKSCSYSCSGNINIDEPLNLVIKDQCKPPKYKESSSIQMNIHDTISHTNKFTHDSHTLRTNIHPGTKFTDKATLSEFKEYRSLSSSKSSSDSFTPAILKATMKRKKQDNGPKRKIIRLCDEFDIQHSETMHNSIINQNIKKYVNSIENMDTVLSDLKIIPEDKPVGEKNIEMKNESKLDTKVTQNLFHDTSTGSAFHVPSSPNDQISVQTEILNMENVGKSKTEDAMKPHYCKIVPILPQKYVKDIKLMANTNAATGVIGNPFLPGVPTQNRLHIPTFKMGNNNSYFDIPYNNDAARDPACNQIVHQMPTNQSGFWIATKHQSHQDKQFVGNKKHSHMLDCTQDTTKEYIRTDNKSDTPILNNKTCTVQGISSTIKNFYSKSINANMAANTTPIESSQESQSIHRIADVTRAPSTPLVTLEHLPMAVRYGKLSRLLLPVRPTVTPSRPAEPQICPNILVHPHSQRAPSFPYGHEITVRGRTPQPCVRFGFNVNQYQQIPFGLGNAPGTITQNVIREQSVCIRPQSNIAPSVNSTEPSLHPLLQPVTEVSEHIDRLQNFVHQTGSKAKITTGDKLANHTTTQCMVTSQPANQSLSTIQSVVRSDEKQVNIRSPRRSRKKAHPQQKLNATNDARNSPELSNLTDLINRPLDLGIQNIWIPSAHD